MDTPSKPTKFIDPYLDMFLQSSNEQAKIKNLRMYRTGFNKNAELNKKLKDKGRFTHYDENRKN